MQTVIETKALCKQYGPHTAVDHVELHVPQGCVYGFIGPNGAGKSTTMKMLLGLIHPTAGRVRLLGQELTEKSRLPLLRQTGSLIESPAGYLHLTAQELEVFYAHTISPAAIAFLFTIVMCLFIGYFHWLLGLIALAAYLIVGIVIPLGISKLSGDDGMKFRRGSGELSGFVLDTAGKGKKWMCRQSLV